MNTKTLKRYLIPLGLVVVFFLLLLPVKLESSTLFSTLYEDPFDVPSIFSPDPPLAKVSASWDLTGTPIVIDDDGGTSGALTWVQASSQPWCTLVNGVYIIENVTIDGQNTDHCILIMDSSIPFIIRQCTLSNAPFLDNKANIRLVSTSNGIITNNSIPITGGTGIWLSDSSNYNEILDNHIKSVSRGINIDMYCENNNISGNTILDASQGGIYVRNWSHNTRITGNNISQVGTGIAVQYLCNNASIIDNHISSGTYLGIGLGHSSYCIIQRNTVENIDTEGISLWNRVNDTVISHNEIIESGDLGIFCEQDCKNLTIEENVIDGAITGIRLDGCSNNIITGNDISNGVSNSIVLIDYGSGIYNSTGNVVKKNLNRNQYGIYIGIQCTGNTVYENAIHGVTAFLATSEDTNSWDNGVIGNYYSSFTTTDANNDGISDISRLISGSVGSIDNYPLVYNPTPGQKIHIDDSNMAALTWENTKKVMWWLEKGTGTEADPYVIEDITIDAGGVGNCVKIEDSNVHFVIQRCTLFNAEMDHNAGIFLDTVTNGKILNNNISHNLNLGIEFYQNCHNINVTGNKIGYNSGNGLLIRLGSSSNLFYNNSVFNHTQGFRTYQAGDFNTFDSNRVFNNDYGLFIHVTQNSTITNSQIFQNLVGIYYRYSHDGNISENDIFENDNQGIYLYASNRQLIFDNTIRDHIYDGIRLGENSKNNAIYINVISESSRYGMFMDNSNVENSSIFNNSFVDNAVHALDNGTANYWNSGLIGNYWDDYTSTDPDDDGIGSDIYTIAGSASSNDMYPQFWDPIVLMISTPLSGTFYGPVPPEFDLGITDGVPESIWYSLDGGVHNEALPSGITTISESLWSGISDGVVQIAFYTNDSRGFVSSDQVVLYKDSQEPLIVVISPTIGQEFTDYVPIFSIDVDDLNLDSIWYSIDSGATNTTCDLTGSVDSDQWSDQPNGVITIIFYANDSAGNVGSVSILVYKNSPTTSSTTTTTEQTTDESTTESQSSEDITSETTSTSQPQTTISAPGFTVVSFFFILPLLYWINRRTKR